MCFLLFREIAISDKWDCSYWVVLQIQARQERHVQDCLPADTTVAICEALRIRTQYTILQRKKYLINLHFAFNSSWALPFDRHCFYTIINTPLLILTDVNKDRQKNRQIGSRLKDTVAIVGASQNNLSCLSLVLPSSCLNCPTSEENKISPAVNQHRATF